MKEGCYIVLVENKSDEKKKLGVSFDNEDDDDEEDGNYFYFFFFVFKKCNCFEELMKFLKVVDLDYFFVVFVCKV